MTGFVEIPKGITGGQPIGAVIFGVAVSAECLITVGREHIDLAEIIRLQQIVSIKNYKFIIFSLSSVFCSIISAERESMTPLRFLPRVSVALR